MNIFYLDKDPYKAAELQYNKHVVKMIQLDMVKHI